MKRITNAFSMPHFGELIHGSSSPWKPCGMGFTRFGLMTCLCDNGSRRHSQVYLGTTLILDDYNDALPCPSSNETIGNPIAVGGSVALVGENGNVWGYDGHEMKKYFSTRFASTCCSHNGSLVILDTVQGKINMRDGLNDGRVIGQMPGDGIAMASCSYQGQLYAAVIAESGNGGLSCTDGKLIRLLGCQCVIPFADQLVYSSLNGLYTLAEGLLTRLDCEKIMDMKTVGNRLYIAGANPDSLWVANTHGEIALVGRVEHGNTTVGGSCFRVRVAVNPYDTQGYFARTANGNQGEIYRIVWG